MHNYYYVIIDALMTINLHIWLLGNRCGCGHFVGNCVHVCVLTQLVKIASKCTDLDVCAFHNYHVMTELSCGVLNSPCTKAGGNGTAATAMAVPVFED